MLHLKSSSEGSLQYPQPGGLVVFVHMLFLCNIISQSLHVFQVILFLGHGNLQPVYLEPGKTLNNKFGSFAHDELLR